MGYKKKSDLEKEFVDYIISQGGLESYAEIYERGHTYYELRLKNGTIRYWADLSDESLERLGMK